MANLKYGSPLSGFVNMRKRIVHPRAVTGPGSFSAFTYKCMLNVDWDGAPDAYGLDRPPIADQMGLAPREPRSLGNARTGADWSQAWCGIYTTTRAGAIDILRSNGLIPPKPAGKAPDVLSPAAHDILKRFWDNRTATAYGYSLEDTAGSGRFPIVQIREMPSTMKIGYYVSTTGWKDDTKEVWDPHRYLDASAVPYSVVPALHGVAQGDYGLVIRNATGASLPYACGDSSGAKHGSHTLGECSGAVYLAMGEENEGDFTFIVFPNSRTGSDLSDTSAAVSAVRNQLRKLSAEDADDLAYHLASDPMARYFIRTAMTRWGAPQMVVPKVDAISGAGVRVNP